MKNIFSRQTAGLAASLVISCALAGCDRKPDANAELEKAARAMQKADAAPPASTSQPQSAASEANPAQEMKDAVAAYKSGQVEDAVARLQRLRATPALTPEQRIALNDAMAAVMSEISTLAAKGDARSIQVLKQYDMMRNMPR